MEWLSQNWGWIILIAGFLGLQLFGRRGHGMGGGCCGGGHGQHHGTTQRGAEPPAGDIARPAEPAEHHH